jgi:hypothetical protein
MFENLIQRQITSLNQVVFLHMQRHPDTLQMSHVTDCSSTYRDNQALYLMVRMLSPLNRKF